MEADEEFVVAEGGTEEDDEQTLEEEEKMDEDPDHKQEIDNLQKEGKTCIQVHNSAEYFRLQKFSLNFSSDTYCNMACQCCL